MSTNVISYYVNWKAIILLSKTKTANQNLIKSFHPKTQIQVQKVS